VVTICGDHLAATICGDYLRRLFAATICGNHHYKELREDNTFAIEKSPITKTLNLRKS
jgi:hypothetical protein